MERRQLVYFLAVAEQNGVRRAAEHLHVSQPTISAAIKQLELEVGGALFERTSAGLVLTAAGEALIEPAGQVLRDLADAAASVSDALGLRGGRLSITAVPSVISGWLPPVLAAFQRAHPGVDLEVNGEPDDGAIATDVRAGRFNVGLACATATDGKLVSHAVGGQELVALLPPGSEQRGEPIEVDELLDRRLVTMHLHRSTSRRWFEGELRRRGLTAVPPLVVGSIEGVLPLVAEGVGYALRWTPVPERAVHGCVTRPVRPSCRRSIHLLLRPGSLPPATRAFVRAVKQTRWADRQDRTPRRSSGDGQDP